MSFGKLYISLKKRAPYQDYLSASFDLSLVDQVIDGTSIACQLLALGLPEAAEVEGR